MIDYSKLNWNSNFNSKEILGEHVSNFIVGVYQIKDFPEIHLFINIDSDEILEVYLDL